jgi:hypothetical protein
MDVVKDPRVAERETVLRFAIFQNKCEAKREALVEKLLSSLKDRELLSEILQPQVT